jgi:hypothetical protein
MSTPKKQRLIYLRAAAKRAHEALKKGEWWDGRKWRVHGSFPGNPKEGAAYRTAHERLGEIFNEMGSGDELARRYGQSGAALSKHDPRKGEADEVWLTLVAKFSEAHLLSARLTVGLLTECVSELKRGRYVTRKGAPWTAEGVKSLLRRRRADARL